MVVMTHNTDISDAWEREGEDPQFFLNFSPNGYAVGLDVVLPLNDVPGNYEKVVIGLGGDVHPLPFLQLSAVADNRL